MRQNHIPFLAFFLKLRTQNFGIDNKNPKNGKYVTLSFLFLTFVQILYKIIILNILYFTMYLIGII